jgi:hypothetical protein
MRLLAAVFGKCGVLFLTAVGIAFASMLAPAVVKADYDPYLDDDVLLFFDVNDSNTYTETGGIVSEIGIHGLNDSNFQLYGDASIVNNNLIFSGNDYYHDDHVDTQNQGTFYIYFTDFTPVDVGFGGAYFYTYSNQSLSPLNQLKHNWTSFYQKRSYGITEYPFASEYVPSTLETMPSGVKPMFSLFAHWNGTDGTTLYEDGYHFADFNSVLSSNNTNGRMYIGNQASTYTGVALKAHVQGILYTNTELTPDDYASLDEHFYNNEVFPGSTPTPTPNQPPKISLNGLPSVTVIQGETYTDEGVTVTDAEDEDIALAEIDKQYWRQGEGVAEPVPTVDTALPGTYLIVYTVTDSGGLSAEPVERTVIVEALLPPNPPDEPQLQQVNPLTGQPIDVGAHIGVSAAENQVTFLGEVTHPQGKPVRLVVQIQRINANPPDSPMILPEGSLVPSGQISAVLSGPLQPGEYRWWAKTKDSDGNESDRVGFKSGQPDEVDFQYGFEPYPFGFQFKNRGIDTSSLGGGFTDSGEIIPGERWDIFNSVFVMPPLSDNTDKINAFKAAQLHKDTKFRGVCWGMSLTAAGSYVNPTFMTTVFGDYWALFNQAEKHVWPLSDENFGTTWRLLWDGNNLAAKPLLKTLAGLQLIQSSIEFSNALQRGDGDAPLSLSELINKLLQNQSLLAGQSLLGFGYISTDGDPQGHAVVPYKIEQQSANIYKIYVYDPDSPDSDGSSQGNAAYDRYLMIDTSSSEGTWSYVFASGTQWPETPNKSAFLELYDVKTLLAGNSRLTPIIYDDNSTGILEGDAQLLVFDSDGKKIGFQNGEYYHETTNIERFVDFAEGEQPEETPPDYLQMYRFSSNADINAEITGKATGAYEFSKMFRRGVVELTKVPTVLHAKDLLTVTENGDVSIVFDDETARTGRYDLYVSNKDGAATEFTAAGLPVMSGATFQFSFNWEVLRTGGNGVTIQVDYTSDGIVDSTGTIGGALNDSVAPVTTAILTGTQYADESYAPGAILTLTAADNEGGTGVGITEYSLDNGTTWTAYATPVVFNDEGAVTLLYRSADVLGNTEESKTLAFTVYQNHPPVLAPVGNQTTSEGQLLSFTLSATDPDGDDLAFTAANLPAGAEFDPDTATFSWTPTFDQAGNYEDINFTVTDSGDPMELDTELITITVGDVNRPPEITPIGPQTVFEDELLAFTVTAADPDGDAVSLSASGLPDGATFDAPTATFTWTPSRSQAGNYTVTLIATDSGSPAETATFDLTITVGDNPTPLEEADLLIQTVVAAQLPKNLENSYLANLKKIRPFLEDGKLMPTLNQLDAFIQKVTQDFQQGKLTAAQKGTLLALATDLQADMQ